MSTATMPRELIHPLTGAKLDPYPFGWRDVLLALPNGEQEWTRVPLTLDDVLHPQEDDIFMPTSDHEDYRNYLQNTMKYLTADNPTATVLSDTNVAWDVPEIRPHRPDIAVIFDVREPKKRKPKLGKQQRPKPKRKPKPVKRRKYEPKPKRKCALNWKHKCVRYRKNCANVNQVRVRIVWGSYEKPFKKGAK